MKCHFLICDEHGEMCDMAWINEKSGEIMAPGDTEAVRAEFIVAHCVCKLRVQSEEVGHHENSKLPFTEWTWLNSVQLLGAKGGDPAMKGKGKGGGKGGAERSARNAPRSR